MKKYLLIATIMLCNLILANEMDSLTLFNTHIIPLTYSNNCTTASVGIPIYNKSNHQLITIYNISCSYNNSESECYTNYDPNMQIIPQSANTFTISIQNNYIINKIVPLTINLQYSIGGLFLESSITYYTYPIYESTNDTNSMFYTYQYNVYGNQNIPQYIMICGNNIDYYSNGYSGAIINLINPNGLSIPYNYKSSYYACIPFVDPMESSGITEINYTSPTSKTMAVSYINTIFND